MEFAMGFIAGASLGMTAVGIMAVQVRMQLEEENIKLRVELKYAKLGDK